MCSAHAHVNCQEPCCRAVQGSIGTSATAVHHLSEQLHCRSSRSRDYCREQSKTTAPLHGEEQSERAGEQVVGSHGAH
ncbi:hypothetical protein BDA96_07G238000 [Sorghum bicolor]|uniref:Uncharacterized protein n=2 Tax=Sorghum bicolor TaxID=4558 RepID=A0A921QQ65_SORBI|nr:hypothetical protein BDA96_07G238000 [Sorghum bicolor]OQU81010.1 hypothetical protein SORBI_3007G223250 [Sorghum bicolor]